MKNQFGLDLGTQEDVPYISSEYLELMIGVGDRGKDD